MANKSFGIYTIGKEVTVEAGDKLILEVGKSHLAAILTKNNNDFIVGFELFTFSDNEAASYEQLFDNISFQSNFLRNPFSSVSVFVNTQTCMPIPAEKFKKQIAIEYLDVLFAEEYESDDQYDFVRLEPAIVNLYKVRKDVDELLFKKYQYVSYKHTWTNVLRNLIRDDEELPGEILSVQFYNTLIIVTVLKNNKLQLIQSFIYETPEDVLYHLLNINSQFQLNRGTVMLQISGLIDLNYQLYRELTNYFSNITIKKVDKAKVLVDINQYPRHYFTPFFNLTL